MQYLNNKHKLCKCITTTPQKDEKHLNKMNYNYLIFFLLTTKSVSKKSVVWNKYCCYFLLFSEIKNLYVHIYNK